MGTNTSTATNFPKTAEIRVTAYCPSEVPIHINYDAPAATYPVPVKGGQLCKGTASVVRVAFDATTPTLTIGDGHDVDGYADNTDLALATALSDTTPAVKLSINSSNPYANGKYYPADDTIDYVWSPGTGGTTGRFLSWVQYGMNVKDVGITP